MARKLREEYPGTIYHAMKRGAHREPSFRAETDWRELLRTIAKTGVTTTWAVQADGRNGGLGGLGGLFATALHGPGVAKGGRPGFGKALPPTGQGGKERPAMILKW